jgi:hypothetical protein
MNETKKSHGRIIIDFNGADFDSKGINLATEVRVEKCEHYDRSSIKSMAATLILNNIIKNVQKEVLAIFEGEKIGEIIHDAKNNLEKNWNDFLQSRRG